MAVTFNADEVFAMAEQIERNGAKFYRKAATLPAAKGKTALLEKLAVMEDEHEKTFHAMREQLGLKDKGGVSFDPNQEAELFLQAVADGHVFDTSLDPSETLAGDETMTDVLNFAIGLEKDSIVFYLGMKSAVGQRLGKDKLDAIIAEEMGHVALLSRELDRLN
ncbi:MAG TPA: ferritin family protein [Planctomycetota bacterium]|nr:ferritin family protein [Planctomycetota bacterium]